MLKEFEGLIGMLEDATKEFSKGVVDVHVLGDKGVIRVAED